MIKKIRCSKGHYYDSKYARCPYCTDEKKKAGGKNSIKDIISEKINKKNTKGKKKPKDAANNEFSYDDGRTMHLGAIRAAETDDAKDNENEEPNEVNVNFDDDRKQYTNQKAENFDSGKTQYVKQSSEDFDGGYTQFIGRDLQGDKEPRIIVETEEQNQNRILEMIPDNAVIGWLVFMNGVQIGNDLRLNRGINYIYFDEDRFLRISDREEKNSRFSISYDEIKNGYVISVLNGETFLNGKSISGDRSLFNNSIIGVNGLKLELIMYCKGINKWKR